MSKRKHGSRTERLFSKREEWKALEKRREKGPYKGFMMMRCEVCGKISAYCAKQETYGHRCQCRHVTPLEHLLPLYMSCEKCGNSFRYLTNLKEDGVIYPCFHCGEPVEMAINGKRTAFVTVGRSADGKHGK